MEWDGSPSLEASREFLDVALRALVGIGHGLDSILEFFPKQFRDFLPLSPLLFLPASFPIPPQLAMPNFPSFPPNQPFLGQVSKASVIFLWGKKKKKSNFHQRRRR